MFKILFVFIFTVQLAKMPLAYLNFRWCNQVWIEDNVVTLFILSEHRI